LLREEVGRVTATLEAANSTIELKEKLAGSVTAASEAEKK
jgi:hypothetical protein